MSRSISGRKLKALSLSPNYNDARAPGYPFGMATTSKQYKTIGEDLWKSRQEKIVGLSLFYIKWQELIFAECRTLRSHLWRACCAAYSRL